MSKEKKWPGCSLKHAAKGLMVCLLTTTASAQSLNQPAPYFWTLWPYDGTYSLDFPEFQYNPSMLITSRSPDGICQSRTAEMRRMQYPNGMPSNYCSTTSYDSTVYENGSCGVKYRTVSHPPDCDFPIEYRVDFSFAPQPIGVVVKTNTAKQGVCPVGNPIYPSTGVKRELIPSQLKISGYSLNFMYDSLPRLSKIGDAEPIWNDSVDSLGPLWRTNFHNRLAIDSKRLNAYVSRANGHAVQFIGDGAGAYNPTVGSRDRLVERNSEYWFYDVSGSAIEIFSGAGKPSSVRNFSGGGVSFFYSDAGTPVAVAPNTGLLIRVQDDFGRAIFFEYARDASGVVRASRITDSSGVSVVPTYSNGFLSSLTWPDGNTRRFVYEEPNLPWALTGVVDENQRRFSTFGYAFDGRAISTQHAGFERHEVAYTTPPSIASTEAIDWTLRAVVRTHTWNLPQGMVLTWPNGASTSLETALIADEARVTSRSQPAGSGCSASSSQMGYDANGNVASRDDFNGNRVCYASDLSRNLETARVEGLSNTATCSTVTPVGATLPAGSRKVSTQWHPDWRLEAKVAEPGRLTTKVYNGQPDPFASNAIASCAPADALLPDGKPIAVLCKVVEQATTDANGALGFNAALQAGVANRQTTYTYNRFGQVLTENGPRTDVNDTTTYAYYSDTTFTGEGAAASGHTLGDLQSVTNAANRVTQYTHYNKHGQVLRSIDPNGVVTDYTYDLRQRLLSSTVGGQTTGYSYDPVGQLKRVSLPDTSWVGYDYDDAHRLVAVYDHKGNRTDYTLDNAGNRIREETKDPSGALKRQLERSIDALGRVQQTTGRE